MQTSLCVPQVTMPPIDSCEKQGITEPRCRLFILRSYSLRELYVQYWLKNTEIEAAEAARTHCHFEIITSQHAFCIKYELTLPKRSFFNPVFPRVPTKMMSICKAKKKDAGETGQRAKACQRISSSLFTLCVSAASHSASRASPSRIKTCASGTCKRVEYEKTRRNKQQKTEAILQEELTGRAYPRFLCARHHFREVLIGCEFRL